ncbi:hypothetical protein OH77DRAFT_1482399 [Trametes cingulata]|nr:hypothetical protein OH77DRAFT_1482399 [Trametes cingulata]
MSAGNINTLLDLWAASLSSHGEGPPFKNSAALYATIDSTSLGAVKWESFELSYPDRLRPSRPDDVAPWMMARYDVWFRDVRQIAKNILGNPEFKAQIDYGPLRTFTEDGERELRNLMSADWAWSQADIISTYPDTKGTAFVPVILGSDKTTVSVATGHNEYYPLYASLGNLHNDARRAHGNGVVLAGFLAIPKTRKKYDDDSLFRKFRRQLFHTSLSRILSSLKDYMTTPEVILCGDGYYRKVIYGLGPYIADYPEQALLTCIVQGWCPICTNRKSNLDGDGGVLRSRDHTEFLVAEFELGELWEDYGIVGDIVPFTNDFPRADIHELIAPDILHQLIKGTFKDHLVTWIELFLAAKNGKARAKEILTDIDRRIAVVPPFSGLRRFHEGRGFKQWTGDDSKALMKVLLPAIDGHLPSEAVRCVAAFLEFTYFVRREAHTPSSIDSMNHALRRFHQYREVFRTPGVRADGFSLPRQHSCLHYRDRIWAFGSPNGLCSSITESKHITAVKEPWRRSNRYEALGQMLLTNQRLDKLAASNADFRARGMLQHAICADAGSLQDASFQELSGDGQTGQASARGGTRHTNKARVLQPDVVSTVTMSKTPQRRQYPRTAQPLGDQIGCAALPELVRRFLFYQLNQGSNVSPADLQLDHCPPLRKHSVRVFHSAEAVFRAPSDPTGDFGIRHELIRATNSWRKGPPRYDCVFVNRDSGRRSLLGMDVARVRLLFDLHDRGEVYHCALVHWFSRVNDAPHEDTGMWIVKPRFLRGGKPVLSVIHLDTIVRSAHLIGVSDRRTVEEGESEHTSLDVFDRFFVNHFVDHHAFDLLRV